MLPSRITILEFRRLRRALLFPLVCQCTVKRQTQTQQAQIKQAQLQRAQLQQAQEVAAHPGTVHQRRPYHDRLHAARRRDSEQMLLGGELGAGVGVLGPRRIGFAEGTAFAALAQDDELTP